MDRADLISEIDWYLDDGLPTAYERTDFESLDFTKLALSISTGSNSSNILDSSFFDLANTLYLEELYRLYFLVSTWTISISILQTHYNNYCGQLSLNL